jgi:hypothetical protein
MTTEVIGMAFQKNNKNEQQKNPVDNREQDGTLDPDKQGKRPASLNGIKKELP